MCHVTPDSFIRVTQLIHICKMTPLYLHKIMPPQRVAVCCSVLQRVAVCCYSCVRVHKVMLSQRVAMCCSVLQRVAVCCSSCARVHTMMPPCISHVSHHTYPIIRVTCLMSYVSCHRSHVTGLIHKYAVTSLHV